MAKFDLVVDHEASASPDEVLRRLELSVNRRLDGILHGEYRGLVPGHGSEQGESREYQPGDDVRRMDWNITARLGVPHVRNQIADRELESWLCLDLSPSLDFGTVKWEKRDLALAAAASIGFLSARGGNRVGAVLDHGNTPVTIPAKQGRKHLLGVLRQIQSAERQERGGASLGLAIDRVARVARRKGFVCVLSDFLDPPETWQHQLAVLHQRHQVLAIELLDQRDVELPDVGLITIQDPETNRTTEVNTSSRKLRERYREEAAAQRANIAASIRASGASHLTLRTDSDWLLEVVRHIATRRRLNAQIGARPS